MCILCIFCHRGSWMQYCSVSLLTMCTHPPQIYREISCLQWITQPPFLTLSYQNICREASLRSRLYRMYIGHLSMPECITISLHSKLFSLRARHVGYILNIQSCSVDQPELVYFYIILNASQAVHPCRSCHEGQLAAICQSCVSFQIYSEGHSPIFHQLVSAMRYQKGTYLNIAKEHVQLRAS